MKNFKHYVKLKATPNEVYNCLTNPISVELWSGYDAKLEPVEGSEFEIFDGEIAGKVLKLEEDKSVMQQWYFGEQEEPSIVTFRIHPDRGGVSLELSHTNIPDEAYDDIATGWKRYYLGAIKRFLE
jgi:activator of HSP90 ATPase